MEHIRLEKYMNFLHVNFTIRWNHRVEELFVLRIYFTFPKTMLMILKEVFHESLIDFLWEKSFVEIFSLIQNTLQSGERDFCLHGFVYSFNVQTGIFLQKIVWTRIKLFLMDKFNWVTQNIPPVEAISISDVEAFFTTEIQIPPWSNRILFYNLTQTMRTNMKLIIGGNVTFENLNNLGRIVFMTENNHIITCGYKLHKNRSRKTLFYMIHVTNTS